MHYELFMDHASDDFSAQVTPGTGVSDTEIGGTGGNNYFLAWFSTKPGMSLLFGSNKQNLEKRQKVSFREEDFGVLMLNRETGKIYKLDCQAAEAMNLSLAGLDSKRIADKLGCPIKQVGELLSTCLV